jgi:hypothetical protein
MIALPLPKMFLRLMSKLVFLNFMTIYDIQCPFQNKPIPPKKVYNHSPWELKQLSNDQKSFGFVLKRFLYANSFYSLKEYFNYKRKRS